MEYSPSARSPTSCSAFRKSIRIKTNKAQNKLIFLSFIIPTSVIKNQRKRSLNETHEDSVSRTVIEKTIVLC